MLTSNNSKRQAIDFRVFHRSALILSWNLSFILVSLCESIVRRTPGVVLFKKIGICNSRGD